MKISISVERFSCCGLLLFLSAWLWLVGCGDSQETSTPDTTSSAAEPIGQQPAPSDQDLLTYVRAQKQADPAANPKIELIPEGDFQALTWNHLADVTFKETYYEAEDEWLWFPTFGEKVTSKAGQPVYISGYVIPLEPGRYVLSKNSFQSCFFCGGAGPETVMELVLKDNTLFFENDAYRTFSGTLEVNDQDIDRLNYILTGAEVVIPAG